MNYFLFRFYFSIPFTLVVASSVMAQKTVTLSGVVSEAKSNESLMGISIILKKNTENSELKGTTSNEYGFYSISLPPGMYNLTVSYIGFKSQSLEINLYDNKRKDITLEESVKELEEVVLTGNSEDVVNIKSPQMSTNVITTRSILKTPTLLGEPDVIRALLLLPGVSNVGEISSGFNVRGGASDQNLVLLDEAILFTTSHFLGIASVFNAYATKDITLYKGGIPANYGGRVSSVLDVYQKEGNNKEFHGVFTMGSLSVLGTLEGPIKKDKASFLLAFRVTPSFLFEFQNSTIGFYDLNTKISYKLDKNNKVYLSGYFGRDVLNVGKLFNTSYGNASINTRWNHIFGSKLFSNLSIIYSDYNYALGFDLVDTSSFSWASGIKNLNVKYDFKHYLNDKLKLYYGLNNIYYLFNPGEIQPSSKKSIIKEKKLTKKLANEFSSYIGMTQKLNTKLSFNLGIRLSYFSRLGQKINVYENNNPVLYDENSKIYYEAAPTSTKTYKSSEAITNFVNLEPRFSLSYSLTDYSSIKMSYTRMSQYLQVITNSSSSTPFDVWAPSGPFIKPILLDQYAVGFSKKINKNYNFVIEAYYKDLKNKIDYIGGAELIANNAIEQVMLNGIARSYGLEFLFRKDVGNITGLFSYTLSKSEQRIKGRNSKEIGINNGNWYNAPQDRVHDLSLTGSYKYNDKWSFNANFIFQTGRPITYPTGQYNYLGYTVPKYGSRNGNRLSPYHRLDISAELVPKKNTRYKSKWIFGIYNVYFRKNTYSISFEQDENNQNKNKAVKTYIFPIFPSISYNITF